MAIEAYSGRTPDLDFFLGVSEFIGIFGVGFTSGESMSQRQDKGRAQGVGSPSYLLASSKLPWLVLQVSRIMFVQKNHAPEGFVSFGFRLIFLFFEILKQAIKQQYGLGLRLVGLSQK